MCFLCEKNKNEKYFTYHWRAPLEGTYITAMKEIDIFFSSFFKYVTLKTVYVQQSPKNMMASDIDEEGWYTWKPIKGTLSDIDYQEVEQRFGVVFPKSFIEWHKRFFFLQGFCRIIDFPISSPKQPLQAIIDNLDNDLSRELASAGLYIFAQDDDNYGPFVFDGREDKTDDEFPIRIYDYHYIGNLDGLSEIILSSFSKLLECITYLLNNIDTLPLSEIIAEFLRIDPQGAGKSGLDFWLERIAIEKEEENETYD